MNLGICPHCKAPIRKLIAEAVVADAGFSPDTVALRTVTFACASCRAVLGVSPDPYALKTAIVEALLGATGRRG